MRKLGLAGLVGILLILVVGLVFFIVGYFRPKVAGIYIDTNPASAVYLNGEQVGKTPYDKTVAPGEIVIRLIPESFQAPLVPYETKITLVAGIKTVIRRDFGESQETSAGEIISFEKVGKDQSNLVVISIPDSAELLIDGGQRTFTPHKTSDIPVGQHTLALKADGYVERSVPVKTHQGYKLTAIVQLALATNANKTEPVPTEKSKEPERPMVEILSTPVGFLRVRNQASSLADEVGRVQPGERYVLVLEDEKTGWYKIEYEEGKEGWISNQYAKKIESLNPGATVTPRLSPTPTLKVSTPSSTKVPTPAF